MRLETLETIGKQALKTGFDWAAYVPHEYHEVVRTIIWKEKERMQNEEQMRINAVVVQAEYDWARGKVSGENLERRALKKAGEYASTYIGVLREKV